MSSSEKPGTLSVVATPIGNLEDITLRALRTLKEADVIAAEDTRHTLKLLNHFQISVPLVSYYQENERQRSVELVQRLLAGQKVALVTDAGTPAISDPGVWLVQAARRQGIPVVVIPGPSALLAALMGAGLPTEAFTFRGFLDLSSGPRRREIEELKFRPETQIFFVAPHRLSAALSGLLELWGGDRTAVLARELTKVHEEFQTGTLAELQTRAAQTAARGEYTLIVNGYIGTPPAPIITEESLEQHLTRLQASGLTLNQAVGRVARERKLSRNEVYALAHGKGKASSK